MPPSANVAKATPESPAPTGGSFLAGRTRSADVFTPEDFSETHLQVKATTDRFMAEEVLPRVEELENKQPGLARKLIERCAEIGLPGVIVPERYGGLEMDVTTQLLVDESVGSYASFSTTYGAHASIGTLPIVFFGDERQKREYLPRLVEAELLGAYCLSEPQAGSDALASLTRADLAPDGTHYVLNGQKMWISNGGWADLYTVFAKIDGSQFTAFLVERSWEGVSAGAEERKLGLHGSSTTALFLDNVKVPVENVLGEVGRGHVIAFNVLNIGRLGLAAGCVGGCKDLLAEAVSYAAQRKAFGRPISDFGAIRQKLADMAVQTFAGETLTYRTSGLIDARLKGLSWDDPDAAATALKAVEEYAVECSIAKVHVSEALDFVADEAVQIHGGYGYHRDYAVERGYRDARINRIYEGTNEINRLLTTGMLLKRAGQGRLNLAIPAPDAGGSQSADSTTVSSRDPLAAQSDIVDRLRDATLSMALMAYKRFGADLERQQEVCAAIADMVSGVYAAESALLRTTKFGTGVAGEHARDLLQVLTQQTLGSVRERGRLILGACCEGADLERRNEAFERRTGSLPANLPAVRDRIAARLLEAGGYAL